MTTQAHLYDASTSPATLLATISAVNLDAASYYQPQVYGGQATAFVNRDVALELSLEISIEGRAEDDATLDLLRGDFVTPASRAYEVVRQLRPDGAPGKRARAAGTDVLRSPGQRRSADLHTCSIITTQ